MRRVILQGLLAHKLRLALTALAIVLGVTFISGAFVLTDTLHNTFTTLFGHVCQNVDFEIRGKAAISSGNGETGAVRKTLPQSIVTSVRRVPGVAYAEGTVTGYADFVTPDGRAISDGGAPTLGFSYDPNSRLSALRLSEGTAPSTSHEVVMDAGTAQKYHFRVGDHVRVLLAGPPETFILSGIVRFGTANNLAGATIAAFSLPVAQRLLGSVGRYDAIDVLTSPGADKSTVQHAIATALPKGVEVVSGITVANERSNDVNQSLSFFSSALLVFAFISLFVGGFTIFNTFSISVGQRTREVALVRIVGASRRQIFRSVLVEALIVGSVASLIGLGLGVLAASGLEALLQGFGITLPPGPLVFEGRTIVVALLVGVGVTVVSAVGPARRAVRIPPVAALADYRASGEESSRRRIIFGWVITTLGVVSRLRPDQAGDRVNGAWGICQLYRDRDADTRRGPADGERDRTSTCPPLRNRGTTRSGEFHAQSAPDRGDCLGPNGRACVGRHLCCVRCVTVQVRHQQCRRCGQSKLHHHEFRPRRRRRIQQCRV